MMFRHTSELRQPLAKEAMAVLAGVYMSVADDVRVVVRDRDMCINLLVVVYSVGNRGLIGTENHASIAVFGDIFISVFQILPNAELNSSVNGRVSFLTVCLSRRFLAPS